jgi:tripartite-type tricarboxylate transporter receptor subunit TctC
MNLRRRQFLHMAAGAAALPTVSRHAWALDYPTRPVRVVVGLPAGGTDDIVARLTGQWLSDRFGQPFVIENRPGASGTIGTEAVVRAPADGYTLLIVSTPAAISATLYTKLNFDIVRDIAPVSGIVDVPNVMVVNPSFPATTVPEFITYSKANPGKISMGSSGTGTTVHVAGELFKVMANIDMLHVPYPSPGMAITGLIDGQVQVIFATMPSAIQQIRAGKLRALAVTTATRSSALPDLPTVADFVLGYEASTWNGVGVPRNTPDEIVATLNKKINAALADADFKARLAELGGTTLAGSPADFGTLIADEAEKWGKVIRAANIKPE